MRVVALITLIVLASSLTFARDPLPEDRGAAGLWQSLKRLQTTARVMSLTAHPDDEDSGTLTYLSRGLGADVTMLILNRGESGANLVSSDFFEGLGALRTLEMLRAAEHYGAKVRFTRFVDYGYSKNVAETFRNWNKEDVLRDVVRIIRREKPHVLISRFQGTPRDGHGNHEAAGLLARLGFDAAGDAARFPELAKEGLEPWKPSKLYLGNFRANEAWTIAIDSGNYDEVLGRSHAQIGRDGYRNHRSQGMALSIARPGASVAYYKRPGFDGKEEAILGGINTSIDAWPTVAGPVRRAVAAFSIAKPEASAPFLAEALAALRKLPSNADLVVKERQLTRALAQSLSLELEALVEPDNPPSGPFAQFRAIETFSIATPGQRFQVAARLHRRGALNLDASSVSLVAPTGWTIVPDGAGRFTVTVAPDAKPTQAYWRRDSVREAAYRLDEEALFSLPLPPSPLRAVARFSYAGVEASLEVEVETSAIDTVNGQFRRALAVGPPVSVRFATEAGVLPLRKAAYEVAVTVRNNVYGVAKGAVRLEVPANWKTAPRTQQFSFEKEREEATLAFTLTPPADGPGDYPISAIASYAGREYSTSYTPIEVRGEGALALGSPARHTVRATAVEVAPSLRVGYIMGTGDDVPEGLRQLGVPFDLIDTNALASGDLAKYSTILVGIRAYAARKDLKIHNQRLLDYVSNGGVLVVQYNTQEFDQNFGPYPYQMTMRAEEISEEDAPVEILDPADPVFQTPNKITSKDFEGWVEQRGSKFLSMWDSRYKPLIASNDTGQSPQRGGWLVARHGKGLYIYCAYAWYRQLPYAVPGAVRIFANLVSLGAADAAWRSR